MKVKFLFVCLGNICRSPSAEAIMLSLIEKRCLSSRFECDSAGTIDYHKGKNADSRMRSHARKRNVNIDSISRPFDANIDFEYFDKILLMDDKNYSDISKLTENPQYLNKLQLISDYCTIFEECKFVPDPYYGGDEGFELVLDILDDACTGLLDMYEINDK